MASTSTGQRSRPKVVIEQPKTVPGWSKVFPAKVETEQQSCLFMKKLVAASISNITYLRNMFPEDAYDRKTLDKVPLRILKAKSSCEKAAQLSRWLLGAFEALEKRYLRELYLVVYLDSAHPNTVHEAYSFKFTYPDGVASCQVEGSGALKAEIQNSARDLLQAVLLMTNSLGPLPETAYLSMKLNYYDEVTPEDFEPAGFQATDLEFLELGDRQGMLAGRVTTAHHSIRAKVHTGGQREIQEGGASLVEDEFLCSQLTQSQAQSPRDTGRKQGGDDTRLVESLVSCECGSRLRDELMLTCSHCAQQQHGACYRILRGDELPAQHCCVQCSNEHGTSCTDSKLARRFARPGDKTNERNSCLYRRTLASLVTRDSVTREFLCSSLGLEEQLADQVFRKLVQDGIVREDTSVNMEVLMKVALPKYVRKAAPVAGEGEVDLVRMEQGSKRVAEGREGRGQGKKRKISMVTGEIGFN